MFHSPLYTFDAFQKDIKARIRRLSTRLRDPGATWPGLLFLDAPSGLQVERFEVAGLSDEEVRDLAERQLPETLRTRYARRFCWAMPVWRESGGVRREYLLLVFGERNRCEAELAAVLRAPDRAPELGTWSRSAFAHSPRRASGRFVEPLLRALDSPLCA